MRPRRWQRARQITQAASLALFLGLGFLTYRGSATLLPLDLYFRLDPLVAFGAMLAARTLVTGMLVAGVAFVLGLVFGRAWCGWLCPLGVVLDWISPRFRRPIQPAWASRRVKFVILAVIAVAALLGNLTFVVFDPITIVNRTFASALLPALNVAIVGTETALYPLAPLQGPLDGIEQAFRGTVLPAQQTFYQAGWLFALLFTSIVALNWAAPRFWCRYLCPLGAIYALQAKFAWLRIKTVSECDHCAACMRACPTAAIAVSKSGFSVDPAECVVCMDCLAECPKSAIAFRFGGDASARTSVDLSRRHFVGSAVAGIAAVTLFRSAPSARRDDTYLVRPPGAQGNDFLTKCIRCAECVKVCPTGGLQPSLFESGVEGIWTPLLVPRLGYCDFSCNACGQTCPTGAIPPLRLEDKRKQTIGTAFLDQNRCIPWAMYRPCVVCQEMCPVPDKAIKLDEVDVTTPDGQTAHLLRPRVDHSLCIGCGICEYQCPIVGPAAIRVHVPTRLPPLT